MGVHYFRVERLLHFCMRLAPDDTVILHKHSSDASYCAFKPYILQINHQFPWTAIVVQLVEWLLPTQEVCSSNLQTLANF